MKVAIEDLLKGQRKAGTLANAEKVLAQVAIDAKEPEKDEPIKTFVLSPSGGEIHRGESVVDHISKPETLREKIARFDRLSAKVRQDRQYLAMMGGEMLYENPDDFDFDDGEYVDDFGDIVVTPTHPVEPKDEPETVSVAEQTADPVEADPTSVSEDA